MIALRGEAIDPNSSQAARVDRIDLLKHQISLPDPPPRMSLLTGQVATLQNLSKGYGCAARAVELLVRRP
jgi:hypothetical protein